MEVSENHAGAERGRVNMVASTPQGVMCSLHTGHGSEVRLSHCSKITLMILVIILSTNFTEPRPGSQAQRQVLLKHFRVESHTTLRGESLKSPMLQMRNLVLRGGVTRPGPVGESDTHPGSGGALDTPCF